MVYIHIFREFYQTFLHYFEICFPLKKYLVKSRCDKSWYNDDLKRFADYVREVYDIYKCTGDMNVLELYRTAHKTYKNKIVETKKRHYDSVIKNSRDKSKTAWKVIKTMTNRASNSVGGDLSIRNQQGVMTTAPDGVAALFREHFEQRQKRPASFSGCTNCKGSTFYLMPTDRAEVGGVLSDVAVKHSAGVDDVPCSLVKYVSIYIMEPLVYVINRCLSEGIFPSNLKLNKIIPCHKRGDVHDVANYRPISLPSVFAKIFEKVINNRLINYLIKYNLISSTHFGFVAGRSTSDAICHAITEIYNKLDRGDVVAGIFFDLSRAFDMVDHSVLISKMQALGIFGVASDLFQSYLNNRKSKIMLSAEVNNVRKNIYSSVIEMYCGIPQGSILGPTLFLIYVNDLHLSLSNCTLSQYADDTTCIVSSTDLGGLSGSMSTIVGEMNNWCNINGLILNTDKTNLVRFKITAAGAEVLRVDLNDEPIRGNDSVKFLGVIMDKSLKFEDHCSMLVAKLSTALYGMRNLRSVVNVHSLRLFYFAYVESRLRYGIIFWGSLAGARRIFIFQKRIIRCMLGVSSLTSCRPLFRELHILPLSSLYIFEILKFYKNNEETFIKNCDIYSNMQTRYKQNLSVPPHNTKFYEMSPRYRAIALYNNLPTDIKTTRTPTQFKIKLQKYLYNHCFYTIDEYMRT